MTKHHVSTAGFVVFALLAACSTNPSPSRLAAGEALVRVRNASEVPLRIRVCGDPCSAYTTARPRETVDLPLDTSRQNRFVVSAMEGDRLVAQEPFTTAAGAVVVLSVQPPDIEQLQ
jgi:hypothetical protein